MRIKYKRYASFRVFVWEFDDLTIYPIVYRFVSFFFFCYNLYKYSRSTKSAFSFEYEEPGRGGRAKSVYASKCCRIGATRFRFFAILYEPNTIIIFIAQETSYNVHYFN